MDADERAAILAESYALLYGSPDPEPPPLDATAQWRAAKPDVFDRAAFARWLAATPTCLLARSEPHPSRQLPEPAMGCSSRNFAPAAAPATLDAATQARWEAWLDARLAVLRKKLVQGIGEAMSEYVTKRIVELKGVDSALRSEIAQFEAQADDLRREIASLREAVAGKVTILPPRGQDAQAR